MSNYARKLQRIFRSKKNKALVKVEEETSKALEECPKDLAECMRRANAETEELTKRFRET